jgi:hypothetical protein
MASLHPNSFEAWLKNKPQTQEWGGGRSVEPFGVSLKTRFLDWVSEKTNRRERLSALRRMQFKPGDRKMAPGHSHPTVAAARADASVFLSSVASALHKRRYDVSISSRELRGLAVGSRQYRAAKDLLSDAVHDRLCESDFVTMVDTDYYMSEAELSRYAGHDIGLYALKPNGLSGKTADSLWSFVTPTEVVEEVAGGAVYRHQIWDWGKDMVALRRGFSTYLYDVVTYDVCPSRVVVVLLLAREVNLPAWALNRLVGGLEACLPSRMQVAKQGEFLVGVFGPPTKRMVQIMVAGATGEQPVCVSPDTYRALSIAAKIPNTDRKVAGFELLPAAVERITRAAGEKVSSNGCYVLSRYFSTSYSPWQMVNYQSRDGYELEDGLATTAVAAVPLAGAGCGPTASANNEARAVKARIVDVANKNGFTEQMAGYAKEFASLVIPRGGQGVPLAVQELRLQQDKTTQRARRLQEEQFLPDRGPNLATSSFQKRETYAKISDPRLINQVPTDHTNRLCAYSGALKPALKRCRWYAVGKTPLQTALAIRGLQRAAGDQLAGGDYSRMDGRTSVAYRRHVLEPVLLRYFAPDYHAEITELLRKEERATTRTKKFKVSAAMGGANISGSGVTTDLNTLDSAFNEYAARRRLGQEPAAAYGALGLYFGDDSLVDRKVFDEVAAVAKENGMKLEREPVPEDAGPGYAVFLARVYPDIRTSLASHPDVVRNLRKLCTVQASPNAGSEHLSKLLRLKVEAALITDSHVPVVAAYARALKRVYRLDALKGSKTAWEAALAESADYQRKKEAGPYPYSQGDRDLLVLSVAQGLGITAEEACLLEKRLDAAATEADLARLAVEVAGAGVPDWAVVVPTLQTAQ